MFIKFTMGIIQKLKDSDQVTKIVIIVIFIVILYILFSLLLMPLFTPNQTFAGMSNHMTNMLNPLQRNYNLISILIALMLGLFVWLSIREVPNSEGKNELSIIKKALSNDEKKILEEIQKAGEITQDSLRFRLDWSKAKVSAILLQLDRMNLIQRERQGKTYNIFIKKNTNFQS